MFEIDPQSADTPDRLRPISSRSLQANLGALLDIGRVIQLAKAAKLANWSKPMEAGYMRSMNDLLLLLQERRIPFVVVGGIALLQHVPGRNTEDLDLILARPRLQQLPELELLERNDLFAKASFH